MFNFSIAQDSPTYNKYTHGCLHDLETHESLNMISY